MLSKPASHLKSLNRWPAFLIIVVCLIIYLPFLSNPFFFDDYSIFTSHASRFYGGAARILELRWLPYATLVWTNLLFLDHPIPFRIGNLVLHAANAFLLFLLIKQYLTVLSTAELQSQNAAILALISCLLFLAHPTAVYAVGYAIQRSIMLATFFVLAMHLCYTHALLNGKKRWLLVTIGLYFLAVFSKEHSILAIATLLASTILFWNQRKLNYSSLAITFAALLLISILLLLRIKGVFGSNYEPDAAQLLGQQQLNETKQNTHFLSALTQASLFFKYLMLWLLPNPAWMSIDMRESFISDISSWKAWTGAIAFSLYGLASLALLFKKGRLGLLGWGLLFPWLLFFVEFSTTRVQEPFVIYRAYLWFAGLSMAVCVAGSSISLRKFLVISLIALTIMIPLSWNRLWVFSDSYLLWNDAALLLQDESTPGASRIYYNRGNAELAKKEWTKAPEDFNRVIRINPEMEQPYNNIGTIHFNRGDYPLALESFNTAISKNPEYAQAYFGKAMSLRRLKIQDESRIAMQKSCDLGHSMACLIIEAQPR